MGNNNNIDDYDENKCCGCGGCISACHKDAVVFKMNIDGYFVAHADPDKCVSCGVCKTVCPKFSEFEDARQKPLTMYCGKNKNVNIQYNSSSGGIVTALAQAALSMGYVVFGAWFDIERRELKHIAIRDKKDLGIIRGSKYLQSYTVDAIRQIAKEEKAAYIGTPCQIYTLRRLFPDKDMLLIDFRCAGTPGYLLINKYIDYLNSINKSGIKRINFRSKQRSWHIWGVKAEYNDGTVVFKDKHHDLFGKFFSRYHDAVHDVCKECSFMNQTYADIRVEDAWHLMKFVAPKDYKNGFSQLAVFTDNGKKLLNNALPDLDIQLVDNDFDEHTYSKREKAGELFYKLRDDKPLEDIMTEFEKHLSLKKKLISNLSHVVSINLYVYRLSRFIYKSITGGK